MRTYDLHALISSNFHTFFLLTLTSPGLFPVQPGQVRISVALEAWTGELCNLIFKEPSTTVRASQLKLSMTTCLLSYLNLKKIKKWLFLEIWAKEKEQKTVGLKGRHFGNSYPKLWPKVKQRVAGYETLTWSDCKKAVLTLIFFFSNIQFCFAHFRVCSVSSLSFLLWGKISYSSAFSLFRYSSSGLSFAVVPVSRSMKESCVRPSLKRVWSVSFHFSIQVSLTNNLGEECRKDLVYALFSFCQFSGNERRFVIGQFKLEVELQSDSNDHVCVRLWDWFKVFWKPNKTWKKPSLFLPFITDLPPDWSLVVVEAAWEWPAPHPCLLLRASRQVQIVVKAWAQSWTEFPLVLVRRTKLSRFLGYQMHSTLP